MMKIWHDQLVLTSGQEIDSLKNALEIIKAEIIAAVLELEKCRKRVNTLSEAGVKLHEEIKNTKASSNIKDDDMKNTQAKALKIMKENHTQRVNSL